MTRLEGFVAAMAVLVASSAASAQEVSNSGGAVVGRIISGSVEDVTDQEVATVLTVPSSGRFVLTLVCSGRRDQIPFSGSQFGFIAQTPPSVRGTCQSLLPGVALNRGEEVTCQNIVGDVASCQASGVLSKR